jgi:hypothetical protein
LIPNATSVGVSAESSVHDFRTQALSYLAYQISEPWKENLSKI